jgi:hypothetical protein
VDPAAAILAALESGEPIGWQVLDADGNVVQSGPVSFAELTSDVLEQINQES